MKSPCIFHKIIVTPSHPWPTDLVSFDLDPSKAAWLSPLDDKLLLVLGAQEDLRGIRWARHHDLHILRLLGEDVCVVAWLHRHWVDWPEGDMLAVTSVVVGDDNYDNYSNYNSNNNNTNSTEEYNSTFLFCFLFFFFFSIYSYNGKPASRQTDAAKKHNQKNTFKPYGPKGRWSYSAWKIWTRI